MLCYFLVEVVEEHVVVELLVESRSDDYPVEIPVVDIVLFVVVGILLLDVVGEKVVVDPIPNLLRWDDVVEAIVGVDIVCCSCCARLFLELCCCCFCCSCCSPLSRRC